MDGKSAVSCHVFSSFILGNREQSSLRCSAHCEKDLEKLHSKKKNHCKKTIYFKKIWTVIACTVMMWICNLSKKSKFSVVRQVVLIRYKYLISGSPIFLIMPCKSPVPNCIEQCCFRVCAV